MIETVKIQGDGYLVNGTMSVPKADGNRHYKEVQEALLGGTENYPIAVVLEPEFNATQLADKMKADYKSLYLGVVNSKLAEKDYDSLATVKLWEGDATYGAEATQILTWYKNIIATNYGILTAINSAIKYNALWADVIPTEAEYLAEINAVVF